MAWGGVRPEVESGSDSASASVSATARREGRGGATGRLGLRPSAVREHIFFEIFWREK